MPPTEAAKARGRRSHGGRQPQSAYGIQNGLPYPRHSSPRDRPISRSVLSLRLLNSTRKFTRSCHVTKPCLTLFHTRKGFRFIVLMDLSRFGGTRRVLVYVRGAAPYVMYNTKLLFCYKSLQLLNFKTELRLSRTSAGRKKRSLPWHAGRP